MKGFHIGIKQLRAITRIQCRQRFQLLALIFFIYLTGNIDVYKRQPRDFIKENIFPLIDEQGKLFRPEAPAVPMPESILTNPLWSGKAYRVAAPSGNGRCV